jgi:hypothetical protein
LIDEDVTKVLFTVNLAFNPASPDTTSDYIVYSKASDDDLDQNNVVYSVKANGSDKTVVIGKNSYTDNNSDLEHMYTISLLGSSVTDGKLAIYYTKETIADIAVTDRGLYGYEFVTDMTFTPANEKCFSITKSSSIYPISFTEGVFILDADPNVLSIANGAEGVAPTTTTYEFPDSITILGISEISGKDYVYYLTSSQIHRFPLDKSENAAIVLTDTYKSGWSGPDFIGNYMFYINTVAINYNYTFMADLSSYSITDEDSFKNVMIGTMTDEDAEAKAKAEEEAEDEE